MLSQTPESAQTGIQFRSKLTSLGIQQLNRSQAFGPFAIPVCITPHGTEFAGQANRHYLIGIDAAQDRSDAE
jgi:hypothetical protein